MTIIDHDLEVAAELAEALAGALPRVAIVISNPVDVLTEYFSRAWEPRGVKCSARAPRSTPGGCVSSSPLGSAFIPGASMPG